MAIIRLRIAIAFIALPLVLLFDYGQWMENITFLFKNTTKASCDLSSEDMLSTFEFSGKELFSIGEEGACLYRNMSYNLLVLHKTDQYNTVYDKESITFFQFLDQAYFYFGFCVPLKCQSTFTSILRNNTSDRETRDNLIELLLNDSALFEFSISLYERNGRSKEDKKFPFDVNSPYFWLLVSAVASLCLRLVVEVIGLCVYSKRDRQDELKEMEMVEKENAKDRALLPDDVIFNEEVVSDIDGCSSPKKKSMNRISVLFIEEKPSCFRSFYDICSFVNGFMTLMGNFNYYYEQRGIKMISFFKVYLLFWLTLNHCLYTMIVIPSKSITQSSEFFTSGWLFILKYSVFANDLWVALDGMLTAYKLMTFTKTVLSTKSGPKRIPFKSFLRFYLNCLPKMVVFFVIFFLFYYYAENIALFFQLPAFFQVFSNHLILFRDCMKDLSILINPFGIYFTPTGISRANAYCFKFATMYLNEFCCFTLIMVLFYVSYALRSGLFDLIIAVTFLLNICLKFLLYLPKCGYKLGYMSLDYIFGSDCSLKYPHLMLNIYIMGFFFGMAWFYFKDMTRANSLQSLNRFKPFNFCFKAVMWIDRFPLWAKKVLIVVSILMQLLGSFSVLFFIDKSFQFNVNMATQLIECYEKDVFRFFFLLMILVIVIYPKDTLIKYVTRAYGFAQIQRVSFSYYCFMDVFIYLFYTLFRSEFELSYLNGVCLTIGLIFFLLLFNIILVICFELPVRMLLKNNLKAKKRWEH